MAIHIRSLMTAPALLVFHVLYDWPHYCSNPGVEEITRSLAANHDQENGTVAILLQIKPYLSNKLKKKGRLGYIT